MRKKIFLNFLIAIGFYFNAVFYVGNCDEWSHHKQFYFEAKSFSLLVVYLHLVNINNHI